MNAQSPEYTAWVEACDAEREAWRKVQGSLPGSLSYQPAAWLEWQECLHRANEALQACLHSPCRRFPKRSGGRHSVRP
jgi:hypothetical protein